MITLLETPRLLVNAPTPADLENYIQLYMDPDVRSLMYTRAKDAAQVASWLNQSILHQEQFGFSVGTVFHKATGSFMGRAGLVHLGGDRTHPEIEIDCFLLKPWWRQHYASELLQGFFNWGFEHLSIPRIVATVYPVNFRAKQLAEQAGMQFRGIKPYHGADFLWYEIDSPLHQDRQ